MSIFNGSGTSDLVEAWSGSNKLQEIWVGDQKVWPSGPLSEASLYLDFESPANFLKNKGTSQDIVPNVTASGAMYFERDRAVLGTDGFFTAGNQSTWSAGYTFTAWVRGLAPNSGWRTLMHRAKPGPPPYENETYFAFNTTGSNIVLFAGLKYGSNQQEGYPSSAVMQAESDWTHVGVRWERASSTTFICSLFVNGQKVSQTSLGGFSSSSNFQPHENELRIGGDISGDVDDIALWVRPLTDEEVLQVFQSGRSAAPQITTYKLNETKLSIPFSQQIEANFPVTSWSATGLPAGLTLNTSTGVLSGTPTTLSSGTATITASGGGITDQVSYSWSVVSPFNSFNVPFNSNADIDNFFPIRGFDGRTASNSPRRAGWTFNGMLVAGDNNVNTYWQILHGTEMPAELAEWNVLMGDVMNTVARPTEIILSSDANLQNQLLLQIGSGNLNLVSRTTGGITSLRTQSRTIGTHSNIQVTRSGTYYTVYHNGAFVYGYSGTDSNAAAWFRTPGRAYTGITMYSTSGQWSSRVSNFSVQERG